MSKNSSSISIAKIILLTKSKYLFTFLIVFSLLAIGFMTVMLTNSVGNVNAKIPLVPDYFPEVRDDLSLVKWAHAVNSREKLQEALNGNLIIIKYMPILQITL